MPTAPNLLARVAITPLVYQPYLLASARLRLAAMATHTPAELRWAAAQIAAAVKEAGGRPAALDIPSPELFVYDDDRDEPAFERVA